MTVLVLLVSYFLKNILAIKFYQLKAFWEVDLSHMNMEWIYFKCVYIRIHIRSYVHLIKEDKQKYVTNLVKFDWLAAIDQWI